MRTTVSHKMVKPSAGGLSGPKTGLGGKGDEGTRLLKEPDIEGQTQICCKVSKALKNEFSRNL